MSLLNMEQKEAVEKISQIIEDLRKQNLNLKEYQAACDVTAKKDFETPKEEIMCWGLGFAGEAGDVGSCIKKTFAHNNDQKIGIRENIGDAMWYAAMICNFFEWDMQEILKENLEKLKARYPAGWSYNDAARGGTMIDWNKR